MQVFQDWLQVSLGLSLAEIDKLAASLATIIVIWILRFLVLRLAYGRSEDVRFRYQWRKSTLYIAVFVATLVLFRVWFGGGGSLLTYLGLLSAGLAIALREPVVNLAAWGFILWRRPFAVGDRIQIGELSGDVIDLRIFQFSLMEIGNWVDADQSTGRILHVPNGLVFSQAIGNYTQGLRFIWNEIPIVITFESNWVDAKEILTRIVNEKSLSLTRAAERRVREAAEKYMIFFKNLTPIVYTKAVDHGVCLTLRYLCHPRKRRGSENEIWESVLAEFAERDDIDFAYPTQRFFDNRLEGKGGSTAEGDEG